MTDYVIDASAAMSWLLGSQATVASGDFILRRTDEDRLVAPYILSWELNNGLLALTRRRGLATNAYSEAISQIGDLHIEILAAPTSTEFTEILEVAGEVGLSLFDTAYLLVALNTNATLISRDAALLTVAQRRGVTCLDLR